MFILCYLSGEIMMRRLIFEQLPTQVGSFWVYALLGLNILVVALILKNRSFYHQRL